MHEGEGVYYPYHALVICDLNISLRSQRWSKPAPNAAALSLAFQVGCVSTPERMCWVGRSHL